MPYRITRTESNLIGGTYEQDYAVCPDGRVYYEHPECGGFRAVQDAEKAQRIFERAVAELTGLALMVGRLQGRAEAARDSGG